MPNPFARIDPASPALAPYARWVRRITGAALPPVAELDAWAGEAGLALADGRPLRFARAGRTRLAALDYERRIAQHGAVPTREGNLHDVCNALAWLAFPRTKAALNERHVGAGAAATRNARDRVRDAATLLDESGLLFVCADSRIVDGLRAHRWRETFGEHSGDVERDVRVLVVGHGLLAKLLSPHAAVTGKALVVARNQEASPRGDPPAEEADARAADLVRSATFGPTMLTPLPLAALPGFVDGNADPERFDDLAIFRPHPAMRLLAGNATPEPRPGRSVA